MVEENRKLIPSEVIVQLRVEHPGFDCSTRTIQNVLIRDGLHGRVCLKKPLLRPINKVRRVEWARAHRRWKIEQWQQVLWSDEKKFELFNSKRRQYCRRRIGEKLRDDTIQATVKHGGGGVMFWGCFGGGKVGDLKKITGIMDKDVYHQILVHHAMPSGNRLFSGRWIFMQDKDPNFKTHVWESESVPPDKNQCETVENECNELALPVPRLKSLRNALGGVRPNGKETKTNKPP